jgi:hypothetical protein
MFVHVNAVVVLCLRVIVCEYCNTCTFSSSPPPCVPVLLLCYLPYPYQYNKARKKYFYTHHDGADTSGNSNFEADRIGLQQRLGGTHSVVQCTN